MPSARPNARVGAVGHHHVAGPDLGRSRLDPRARRRRRRRQPVEPIAGRLGRAPARGSARAPRCPARPWRPAFDGALGDEAVEVVAGDRVAVGGEARVLGPGELEDPPEADRAQPAGSGGRRSAPPRCPCRRAGGPTRGVRPSPQVFSRGSPSSRRRPRPSRRRPASRRRRTRTGRRRRPARRGRGRCRGPPRRRARRGTPSRIGDRPGGPGVVARPARGHVRMLGRRSSVPPRGPGRMCSAEGRRGKPRSSGRVPARSSSCSSWA